MSNCDDIILYRTRWEKFKCRESTPRHDAYHGSGIETEAEVVQVQSLSLRVAIAMQTCHNIL
jgi:hypothetical protein